MKVVRRVLEILTVCALGIWLAALFVSHFRSSQSAFRSPVDLKSQSGPQETVDGKKAQSSHQGNALIAVERAGDFREASLDRQHQPAQDRSDNSSESRTAPGRFGLPVPFGNSNTEVPGNSTALMKREIPRGTPATSASQEGVVSVSWLAPEAEHQSDGVEVAVRQIPVELGDDSLEQSSVVPCGRTSKENDTTLSPFPGLLVTDQGGAPSSGGPGNLEVIAPPPPILESSPAGNDNTKSLDHNNKTQIELREADIRDTIHTLAKEAGINVLLSNSVQGKLSLSLNDLTPREALLAVLKAAGFVWYEDNKVIYVGTSQEIKLLEQLSDQISTRIYRPNYVSAKELESLIKPLVSADIGLVTVSSAAEKGIAPNPSDAGGDSYAGSDVVIVRDYEKVLQEIDRIVAEVDVRPRQVAIEAMILSVNLDDKDQFGISFELLRNKGYIKFGWGFLPNDLSDVKFENSGLKLAYLDASLGAFINALESLGDTNVIATPRLLVLNKHRAEILIGKELGYVSTTITETSASQTVDFLKVGAQLVIRPFISNDGLIRMEVHPEVSTGAVQITNNFTVPNKDTTQVTTNILVPDGATVIIGGLMREDLQTTSSQIPFLGNLPIIGAAFRNRVETTTKQEIIVLITPHIVGDYEVASEGQSASDLWRRRQRVVADNMNPLGNHAASRRWVEKARVACAQGDYARAQKLAELAVRFDPNNVEAIALRDQLARGKSGARTVVESPTR